MSLGPAVPEGLRFDVERHSVRVVVLDRNGSVLLFRTHDPVMPGSGEWWELPGGGREGDETVAETAARELAEETGFVVPLDEVGAPSWRRALTYVHRHRRILQHEVVVTVRLDASRPAPVADGRTTQELEEYTEDRWWEVDALVASRERFSPGRLPELIVPFLGGEQLDEPFEHWN